jgi:uncharacterized protein DUF6496
MARYSKKAQSKVKRAMHERKRGTLKSGRSGKKVKSRKQAIAIGLSEARRAGAKVPKRGASKRKSSAKRASKRTATTSRKSSTSAKKRSTANRKSRTSKRKKH